MGLSWPPTCRKKPAFARSTRRLHRCRSGESSEEAPSWCSTTTASPSRSCGTDAATTAPWRRPADPVDRAHRLLLVLPAGQRRPGGPGARRQAGQRPPLGVLQHASPTSTYSLTVTDRDSSKVATYYNPPLQLSGQGAPRLPAAGDRGRELGRQGAAGPSSTAGLAVAGRRGSSRCRCASTSATDGSPRCSDPGVLSLPGLPASASRSVSATSTNYRFGAGTAIPGTDDSGYFWFFYRGRPRAGGEATRRPQHQRPLIGLLQRPSPTSSYDVTVDQRPRPAAPAPLPPLARQHLRPRPTPPPSCITARLLQRRGAAG